MPPNLKFVLGTDSPNIKLTKVSHYMVFCKNTEQQRANIRIRKYPVLVIERLFVMLNLCNGHSIEKVT